MARLVEATNHVHLVGREIEIGEIEILPEPMRAARLWQHLARARVRVGVGVRVRVKVSLG